MKCDASSSTIAQLTDHILGWMDLGELQWLAEQAAQASSILEVGVWKGRSSVVLLSHTLGRVDAVDPFESTDDVLREEYIRRGSAALEADWRENIAPWRHRFGQLFRSRLGVQAHARTYDFIFIDGAHDVANVRADLDAYWPLVRRGGLCAGHDWGFPGVRQAVTEASLGPIAHPVGAIWCIR